MSHYEDQEIEFEMMQRAKAQECNDQLKNNGDNLHFGGADCVKQKLESELKSAEIPGDVIVNGISHIIDYIDNHCDEGATDERFLAIRTSLQVITAALSRNT